MREQEPTTPNATATETTLFGISEILSSSSSSSDVSGDSAELARILREHNVEYAQKVPPTLLCPVCTDPAKQPVSHRLCTRLFCRECLSQWIHRRTIVEKQPAECPHCRELLLPGSCESARHMERVLDEYPLYCPHCKASVLRGELMSHISSACPVTSIKRELEAVKEQLIKERAESVRVLEAAEQYTKQFEADVERRSAEKLAALQETLNKEAAELSRQKKEFRDALNASSTPIPTAASTATPKQSKTPYAPGSMVSSTATAVVHLNVSGTKISVSRQLLLAYPHSLLARQLTGDLPAIYDEQQRLLVNANPILFRYIIGWLSTLKADTSHVQDNHMGVGFMATNDHELLLLDAMNLKMYHLVLKLLPFRTQWSNDKNHQQASSESNRHSKQQAFFSYEEQEAIDAIVYEHLDRIRLAKISTYNKTGEVLTVPTTVRCFNDFNGANWSERYLENEDLSHCKMRHANLRKSNLQHAMLVGCDLQEADLEAARMQSADLQQANLQRANLQETDLRGANLRGADLRGCQLKGANLRGAILDEANLSETNLQSANLEGVSLIGAILTKTELKSAKLKGANLENANLKEADLQQVNLSRASMRGANLQRAQLSHADLSHSNLSQADLSQADLMKANLQGANLQGANLQGAQLKQANLEDANLVEVNLQQLTSYDGVRLSQKEHVMQFIAAGNKQLRSVNLKGVDLSGCDLSDSNLSSANLSSINLSGANLSKANLTKANLSGAVIRNSQLTSSILNEATIGDADFTGSTMSGAQVRNVDTGVADIRGLRFQSSNDTVVTHQSNGYTTYVIGTSSASKPLLVLSRKQKQSPIAELSRYRFDFRIENTASSGLYMVIGLIPESTAAMGSNSLSDVHLSDPKLRGFGFRSNGYFYYYSKQRQSNTGVSYGGIGTNNNTYSIGSKICPGTTIVSMVVNVCTGYLEYLIDDVSIGVAPIFAYSNTDTEYRSSSNGNNDDNGRESMQRYMDINGDSSRDEGWVPCISLYNSGTRVRLMSDTLRCITTTTVL